MFVIDEAHCLKTWGSGDKPFRKNFSDLAKCIAKLKVSAINSVNSIILIILNNVSNIVHNRIKPKLRQDRKLNNDDNLCLLSEKYSIQGGGLNGEQYFDHRFQNRPVVLCLTATLTEVAEKLTLRSLGLDPDTVHKIEKNPVSRRISFHNKSGCLDIQPLVEHFCTGECPRVIIFEASLLNCGARYLEFKEVVRRRSTIAMTVCLIVNTRVLH